MVILDIFFDKIIKNGRLVDGLQVCDRYDYS